MRQTRQKDAVYDVVKSAKCHPNAEWVYEAVRKSIPTVSLGTIYRNLKALSDAGQLLTLETEMGKIHYDGDTSPHVHFVCKECGKIYDLFYSSCYESELKKSGFTLQAEKTVFYGKCPKCTNEQIGENKLLKTSKI